MSLGFKRLMVRIYRSYGRAFTGRKPKSGPFQQKLRKMVRSAAIFDISCVVEVAGRQRIMCLTSVAVGRRAFDIFYCSST